MSKTKLMQGDNIESLKKLPDNSIDSVVTDGPYGLSAAKNSGKTSTGGFMGKKLDYDVPSVEFWKEVYRVLKPGGHVLSFGGSRTYHRMTVNIEDGGFEIRDCISWIYGSGFPKSHNIGKAVDKFGGNNLLSNEIGTQLKEARTKRGLTLKAADELFCGGTSNYNWLEGRSDGQRIPNGELFDKIVAEWPELKDIRDKVLETEREILGTEITNKTVMSKIGEENEAGEYVRTKGQSQWEGWGTAMKPAQEIICVARKPLSEKSVAENVLKWGTGGINIDGCRVGTEVRNNGSSLRDIRKGSIDAQISSTRERLEREDSIVEGRFPANIILDEIAGELLDEQSGISKSSKGVNEGRKNGVHSYGFKGEEAFDFGYNDKGGASRYFQQIKGGGTEDFFIYKENNIILWNIKSLTTQEYNTEENIEASDALKQARESICQKPELYGNNTTAQYLMTTIYITKMKTHSIMNLTILNAYTKTTIGNFTLMIDEKQSHLLTEENILNVQIVSNQNALVSSIKTNQEVLVPIVSYVLEENLKSGETIIENTITNTTENIKSDRFFYQAKVSKAERNMGLDGFEEQDITDGSTRTNEETARAFGANRKNKTNTHPTVKPVSLMAYLCRLVTPPGGIVLDPFMGSGSTGIAAQLEGFRFVGMEMDEDYFKIASARIENFEKYRKFIK
jgi:site-specific DNA-methyltransferase (adenine-specific)